ncbi:MAG: co-chaperone GroES [Candidatus Buchananbacteria bacterium RIFCSPHIGHO2_01_FULL_46_12]|uniref:Co-chaperonin GroES n=1 Tax=Candidatus Buchananbacteria bacterium RIFCSPHIGHO2_01_FULL_46_12 TaxID=1797536 RepID=A0A1G1Y0W9_9BACT|nr:MAG: co-chaperone GroES [Candidatus Buchananbacteria bacterium RIFCSPHIGHO2_01_FULL_46_12]
MKLKPLSNRVIVKPLTEIETTKSGIILPETVDKEKKAEGEVVGIGDGQKVLKLGLKVGDKVLFGKYAGEEVKVDEVEYKILSEEDVLAVIE